MELHKPSSEKSKRPLRTFKRWKNLLRGARKKAENAEESEITPVLPVPPFPISVPAESSEPQADGPTGHQPTWLIEGPSAPPNFDSWRKGRRTGAPYGSKAEASGDSTIPARVETVIRAAPSPADAGGDDIVPGPSTSIYTPVEAGGATRAKGESNSGGTLSAVDGNGPQDAAETNLHKPHTELPGRQELVRDKPAATEDASAKSPPGSRADRQERVSGSDRCYTSPGYEWATSANGYDWEARRKFYGSDNPTLGVAYQREMKRREAHAEEVIQKLRRTGRSA